MKVDMKSATPIIIKSNRRLGSRHSHKTESGERTDRNLVDLLGMVRAESVLPVAENPDAQIDLSTISPIGLPLILADHVIVVHSTSPLMSPSSPTECGVPSVEIDSCETKIGTALHVGPHCVYVNVGVLGMNGCAS